MHSPIAPPQWTFETTYRVLSTFLLFVRTRYNQSATLSSFFCRFMGNGERGCGISVPLTFSSYTAWNQEHPKQTFNPDHRSPHDHECKPEVNPSNSQSLNQTLTLKPVVSTYELPLSPHGLPTCLPTTLFKSGRHHS